MAKRRYYPYQFDLYFYTSQEKILITKAAACGLPLSNSEQIIQVIIKDVTDQVLAERAAKKYLEETEKLNEKLTELSNTDALTGLTNIRQFKIQLEAETIRAHRYASTYAIVFMDIDNFKHYNDKNGHPAGDELLKHFAQIVKQAVRLNDLPARYGGEEFIVLCPAVTAYQAHVLAERIRKAVSTTPFAHAQNQPLGCISVSIGISGFPEHADNIADLLKIADEALYQSKENGRNRITIAKKSEEKP
jgi:diguanylate cyclase (GGDEF)-like protein